MISRKKPSPQVVSLAALVTNPEIYSIGCDKSLNSDLMFFCGNCNILVFLLKVFMWFLDLWNCLCQSVSMSVSKAIEFFWNFTWSWRVLTIKIWRSQISQKFSHFGEKPKNSFMQGFLAFVKSLIHWCVFFYPKKSGFTSLRETPGKVKRSRKTLENQSTQGKLGENSDTSF